MTIGQQVKNARILRNLTVQDLANKTETSNEYIESVESEMVKPDLFFLEKMAGILNISFKIGSVSI